MGTATNEIDIDRPADDVWKVVRDFGGLNLALALLLIVALVVGSRILVTTAAGAYLLFAVPHFLYHLFNLQVLSSSDQVANTISLAISVVIPVGLVWAAYRTSEASSSRWSAASP